MQKMRFCVITGEEQPIEKEIDAFFKEVMEEIGIIKDKPLGLQFQEREFEHTNNNDHEFLVRLFNHKRSDGSTRILFYKEQPIAIVVKTRNDANYVEITFFKNTLDLRKSELEHS